MYKLTARAPDSSRYSKVRRYYDRDENNLESAYPTMLGSEVCHNNNTFTFNMSPKIDMKMSISHPKIIM